MSHYCVAMNRYQASPPPQHQASLNAPSSWGPAQQSMMPVAYSQPWSPPTATAARGPNGLGIAAIVVAALAVPALGLALMNLAQTSSGGLAGLPEFAQRLAFEANMRRVLMFGAVSLAVGLVALVLGGFAHRSTTGRVGLALGSVVVLGSLFAQASRASASFSPSADPRASREGELDQPLALGQAPQQAQQPFDAAELDAAIKRANLAALAPTAAPTSQSAGATKSDSTNSNATKSDESPTANAKAGSSSVSGKLAPDVIQRVVRKSFGRYRACYENGLRSDPKLAGKVTVNFVIGSNGAVSSASGSGDLPSAVTSCVTSAFRGLSFPQPEGGSVKVSYPIAFSPSK